MINLRVSALLLFGAVLYLKSLNADGLERALFLFGSYLFIPAAITMICTDIFSMVQVKKEEIE